MSLPSTASRSKATNVGGRFPGELGHARGGGMQPQLQRSKSRPSLGRDHDLAVDHAPRRAAARAARHAAPGSSDQRLQLAALDVDVVAAAKDDGAEAVPLGLVQDCAVSGKRLGELGQHRLNGRIDRERARHSGKVQARQWKVSPSCTNTAQRLAFSAHHPQSRTDMTTIRNSDAAPAPFLGRASGAGDQGRLRARRAVPRPELDAPLRGGRHRERPSGCPAATGSGTATIRAPAPSSSRTIQ